MILDLTVYHPMGRPLILVPATIPDMTRAEKAWKDGDVVTIEVTRKRSGAHHRYVFALLNFILGNQELFDSGKYLQDLDGLRRWMTLHTSFVHVDICPLTGETIKTPRSWSYDELDEDEFGQLHSELNSVSIRLFFRDWDERRLEDAVNINQAQEGLLMWI